MRRKRRWSTRGFIASAITVAIGGAGILLGQCVYGSLMNGFIVFLPLFWYGQLGLLVSGVAWIMSRDVPAYEPRFESIRGTTDCGGEWAHRHPWSVPGPAYGCDWNDMCLSAFETSPLILFDERAEFVWRQPRDRAEEALLMEAMQTDVTACYNVDGRNHWTRAEVEVWRRDVRPQIVAWARSEAPESGYGARQRERRDALLRYYADGLDEDLDALVRQLPQ